MRDFCFKLKSLKRSMKTLLRDNYSEIEKRVRIAVDVLHSTRMVTLNSPSPKNLAREVLARDACNFLRLAEESFFR